MHLLKATGRTHSGILMLLSAAALLPFLVAEYPPLYDYYHWVFQGHILKALLSNSTAGIEAVRSLYELKDTPTPNLAAPAVIGLLSIWLPDLVAGRVFLVLCALLFALAFAYLVRSAQRQPTAIEFLGFAWAFGDFMYKGYHSYLFSLALALLAIGKMHRIFVYSSSGPKRTDLAILIALGLEAFLGHFLGWAVLALATAVYAFWLARQHRRRDASLLVGTLLPSVIVLAWYILGETGSSTITFYDTVPYKLLSIVTPFLLFMRTEPFQSPLQVFWINLLALLLLAGTLAVNLVRSKGERVVQPLMFVGGVLFVVALLIPVDGINEAVNPDERFAFAALLVIIASIRYKEFTLRRGLLMGCVVSLVIGYHAIEYRIASQSSAQIEKTTVATIPSGVPVLSLTVFKYGVRDACDSGDVGFSTGTPTLRWFGLNRLIDTGTDKLKVNLMQTSLVRAKFNSDEPPDFTALVLEPEEIKAQAPLGPRFAKSYPYIQLFGCPTDIQATKEALVPQYSVVTEGQGFAILHTRR